MENKIMNEIQRLKSEARQEKIAKYRAALKERDQRDRDIITDYQNRFKVVFIAKKYNVSRALVYKILADWEIATHAQKDGPQ
jgi:DNA invertase Pin-like site-specific DNA recombinase